MIAILKKKDLIVSESTTPFLRAGYANFIFPLIIIGSILFNQALIDFNISQLYRAIFLVIFILLWLKVYAHSISRISFNDENAILIIGPFSDKLIKICEIYEIRVYDISASMTICLKIKRKTSILSTYYFFVAVGTNYGSYSETKSKLIFLFNELSYDKQKLS